MKFDEVQLSEGCPKILLGRRLRIFRHAAYRRALKKMYPTRRITGVKASTQESFHCTLETNRRFQHLPNDRAVLIPGKNISTLYELPVRRIEV